MGARDDVPVTLPALMRAQKVISRMTTVQAEPNARDAAILLAQKKLTQLKEETSDHEKLLGELLESCCALAHALDIDAETALRSATANRIDGLRGQSVKKD